MPVCVVCSGNDFICESGFYFCAECQTQSQDVREQIHENDTTEDEGQTIGGKRRKSARFFETSHSEEENMTSWEGFNFALVGLVDELICLGADPSLKLTVLNLWIAYLRKMEVAFFSPDDPALPKLGPNFKKYDAKIMYGYAKKNNKTLKVKSGQKESIIDFDESVSVDLNDSVERKRALKQNRAAFQRNYEKMIDEMSATSQTLTDITLEMINVSDFQNEEPEESQTDAGGDGTLHCHPGLLLRNKLLCFLYLALLTSGSTKFTLSDLLRWIAEGHLSYSNLARFFPPEVQLQEGNFNLFSAYQPSPPYGVILSSTANVAAYIGLKTVTAPSLKDLIQRYVKELNLPAQIGLLAERLSETLPKLRETVQISVRTVLPNWEGRAMALIVIALKLLFGLDDATEHRNSRIARRINELITLQNGAVRLFVWDDWVQFSILRRLALTLHHEPSFLSSKLSTSMIQNVNPCISAWKKKPHVINHNNKRSAIVSDTYRRLVKRLQEKDCSPQGSDDMLSFPPSITPLTSYTELIIKAYREGRIRSSNSEWSHVIRGLDSDLLNQNFGDTIIDYLTHPNEYIQWAQRHGLRIGLHSGSAAPGFKNLEKKKAKDYDLHNFHRVKIYLDSMEVSSETALSTSLSHSYCNHKPLIFPKVVKTGKKNPLPPVSEMQVHPDKECIVLEEVTKKVRRKSMGRPKIERKVYEDLPKSDEDNMLHTPHTEYWTLHYATGDAHRVTFAAEVERMPKSFLSLLEECSTLIQMNTPDFYKEIVDIERLLIELVDFLSHDAATSHSKLFWLKNRW